MRLEFTYWKRNPDYDPDEYDLDPDGYDTPISIPAETMGEADSTYICATEIHPVDHHEYGLMVHITDGAIDESGLGDHYRYEIRMALERYLAENPDGDPNA